jgi:N4-gp56 family major capsid protein
MADAYTTFAGIGAVGAANVWIAAKMIKLLQRNLVLQKGADPYPLESKMGKTLRVIRVERLSLPTSPLVEYVTPPTNAFVLTNVDVTVEQWGLVAAFSDMIELTVKEPTVSTAIDRVSMAMKETFEREDANVLMGATNVTFPGVVTTRSGLVATDVFSTALAITIKTKLAMRGAPKYSPDGSYLCFMQPPHTAAVLASDQVFQQASNFAKEKRLEFGYVGMWMGLDCVEGNFLPIYVGVPQADTAAVTAVKARYTVGFSGTLTTANYQLKVVAREITTDYERRISVQTGNVAVTSPGSVAVQMPSSTNYVYDVYMTQAGGTTAYLVASRQAASSTFTITNAPAGTEAVAPVSPANGIYVYPGFVCGAGAYGTCTLNGMSLQTGVTPKGPSDSDPLWQRRKFGAKACRKTFILENAFLERFETASAIAPPLAA